MATNFKQIKLRCRVKKGQITSLLSLLGREEGKIKNSTKTEK